MTKTQRFLGRSALSTATVAGFLLAASSAVAQTGSPTAADNTSDDSVIIVTGSRLVSPSLTSASPLQPVTAAAIASTGASNLQDVLLQNPVFGTPTVSRTNSNFSTSGAGLATVDLRNLGTARTLVLVNGRRFVSGSPNDQAVDLNTIPTAFIERVDVLTGGASSIYGSDAVAGVVNIIYKTNFEGIEGNIQAGISQRGDDASKQANLTIGGNFADDRGNVIAYVGYSRDGSVFSRDRARSAIDQTTLGGDITGDTSELFTAQRPFYSSFAPQGRFFDSAGASYTFDPNGNFVTGFSTNGTPTRAANGFNRSAFRTIAIPVERYLIATRANYEIDPAVNVYIEGTFAKSHTVSILEPFPLSSAGTNGVFQGTGGYFPVEQPNGAGGFFVNPYVPTALLAFLTDRDGDGTRDVSFTRRMADIDNRGSVADRTTYRIVAGVQGDISPKWHYDAYFNYGRTDDNQTSTGQVNLANMRAALAVVQVAPGTAGGILAPDGVTTIACADVNARSQGCVPINIFGANKISAAAAQYVRADQNRSAFASQTDAAINVTGELFDLWGAGPAGVAFGGEYRKERSAAVNDSLTQAGLNGGNAIPNTSGAFDVYEGYIEGRLPLLTNRPFFEDLELRGAGRVSKYSTIGTVYSWNIGGEYAPVSDVRFRAVRARATRAPNVTELFQGLSQTFPTGLIDPCVGVTATSTGSVSTNCRAAPGVNANIAANGAFTLNQSDLQGISGFDGGNPNLQEERADTITIGAVIAPRSIEALRNFTFTVDYSRTKIKGAIQTTDRAFILQQCYANNDPTYCQFIVRRPATEGANSPGSIQFVNSGATNSGGVLTSAIDVTASYRQNLDSVGLAGVIDLGISYTRLLKGYVVPLPGADRNQFAGEVGASRNRFLLTANYEISGIKIQYRGTYIGSAYLDDQFVQSLIDGGYTHHDGSPLTSLHDPDVKVGARFISDLQFSFSAGDHFEFYVGANNLFDVSPPPIVTDLPGDVTGAETDSGTYDAIGRRMYAGARIRF